MESKGWEEGMSTDEFVRQKRAEGLAVYVTKYPLFGPVREHMDANGIDRTMVITMGSRHLKCTTESKRSS